MQIGAQAYLHIRISPDVQIALFPKTTINYDPKFFAYALRIPVAYDSINYQPFGHLSHVLQKNLLILEMGKKQILQKF